MQNKYSGFSLIEVIIATFIITISVFGVYKLIGENTKIITNSSNYLQVNSLFPVTEECIEYQGFDTFIGDSKVSYNFNFGHGGNIDECNIGVSEILIDNVNYYLKGEITNSGSNFIEWVISVSSDEIKTVTGSYRQLKK